MAFIEAKWRIYSSAEYGIICLDTDMLPVQRQANI